MSIIETSKAVAKLIKKGAAIEAQKMLMQLHEEALELQEENLRLKIENLELQEKVIIREQYIIVKETVTPSPPYPLTPPYSPLSPLSPYSYDEKQLLIHLNNYRGDGSGAQFQKTFLTNTPSDPQPRPVAL
jgi:hypothetical protein